MPRQRRGQPASPSAHVWRSTSCRAPRQGSCHGKRHTSLQHGLDRRFRTSGTCIASPSGEGSAPVSDSRQRLHRSPVHRPRRRQDLRGAAPPLPPPTCPQCRSAGARMKGETSTTDIDRQKKLVKGDERRLVATGKAWDPNPHPASSAPDTGDRRRSLASYICILSLVSGATAHRWHPSCKPGVTPRKPLSRTLILLERLLKRCRFPARLSI